MASIETMAALGESGNNNDVDNILGLLDKVTEEKSDPSRWTCAPSIYCV